jgi:hypothetical protein
MAIGFLREGNAERAVRAAQAKRDRLLSDSSTVESAMENRGDGMSGAAPQRTGPAWGKIIGFGCGGCALLALLVGLLMFVGFRALFRQVANRPPLPAAQMRYAGDWQGADGSTLSIRADGSGTYRSGSTSIDGGTVKINEPARTLELGLFGINKSWRIDQPPRAVRGRTEMKLNGMVYRRTGGFDPS